MKLRLYHYWRSSCSWRVRLGFALKGVECEFVAGRSFVAQSDGAGAGIGVFG